MSNDFIFYLLSTARTSRGKNNLELDESAEYFFDYDLISKFASNASLVARRLDNHRVFGQPRSQEGVVDHSLLWEDERPWERGWCLVTRDRAEKRKWLRQCPAASNVGSSAPSFKLESLSMQRF